MFQGGVTSTDDESIDTLFGAKTPGADDIIGGKKEKKDSKVAAAEPNAGDSNSDEESEEQDTDKLGKGQETPLDKIGKKSSDEIADELFGKEETEDDADKPKIKAKPAPKAGAPEFEVDYHALYEQLVKDNVFGEVEVPENFVWDADGFKEVQKLQVKSQYDDLLDKTGPYGKAIIDYEKSGGNPGELLSLFREHRTVQEFDISTAEGQEEFLTSYLESQGNSVKSVDRTIKALIDQGEEALKEEAEEKKTLWDNEYKQEIERVQTQQKLEASELERQAREFGKTISDTLTSDTEVTPKERKDLQGYILSYDKRFQGRDVSQFYLDMTDIQKDPTAYVELAKFIRGLKSGDYKKKIADKTKREVSAKTFMKVKNGAALSNRNGGEIDINDGNEGSSFVTLLSNKKK